MTGTFCPLSVPTTYIYFFNQRFCRSDLLIISFNADIDECATDNGGCERNCTKIIGSFNCSCGTGYELDGNGLNCTGEC